MSRSTTLAAVLLAAGPLALLPAVTSASAAKAPAAGPGRAFVVKADINTDEAVAKESVVKVRGKVSPKAAGQKVILQQRMDGKKSWGKSGTAKVKKNGKFVLTDKPSVSGVRFYRVYKPGSNGIKAGISKEMQLDVWGWDDLAYRSVGAKTNVIAPATSQIATKYYYGSLMAETAGSNGFVEFTLGKKCRSLRATYALDDKSATGSSGSVAVSADGTAKANHLLAVGTIVEDATVDVTNVFRVRFDFTSTGDGPDANAVPDAYPAVGRPEVLCLD